MAIRITDKTWKQAIASLTVDVWGYKNWSLGNPEDNKARFPDLTPDQRDCIRQAVAAMNINGRAVCSKSDAQKLLNGDKVRGQIAPWDAIENARSCF